MTKSELITMKQNEKYLKRKEDKKTGKIFYEKDSFIGGWMMKNEKLMKDCVLNQKV